jgi:hypothetical protein
MAAADQCGTPPGRGTGRSARAGVGRHRPAQF